MSTYTALARATCKANVRDAATLFFTVAFPLVPLVVSGLLVQGRAVAHTGPSTGPALELHLDSRWPLALPAMMVAVTAFLGLGAVVGARTHAPEAVAAIANCALVPIALLSSSFYPTDLMPDRLQVLSQALPLRYVNDAMAYPLAGQGSPARYGVSLAVLMGFSALLAAAPQWTSTTGGRR